MNLITDQKILDFQQYGYMILEEKKLTESLRILHNQFNRHYYEPDLPAETSRRKIGLMAGDELIQRYLIKLQKELTKIQAFPIRCGPTVTHFTSTNSVGNSFGLDWHQDWPSMASSLNSLVLWTSLTPSTPSTHGLEVIPSSHKLGIARGQQTDFGYMVEPSKDFEKKAKILNLPSSGVVIFSSFLIHRTFMNPEFTGHKIAFSQRFDDLYNKDWQERSYVNAYKTYVDRDLFLESSN
tara:strand:- start:31 stop:744 length:714 start_codon:yes stop_codon:yes gene_type:complete